jgi:hypothetical protein
VASVPEQAKRTISTAGHMATIFSATATSSSLVIANSDPWSISAWTFASTSG